jgi:putative transposase
VARLLRAAGLVGRHRRRRVRTTVADPAQTPAPTLVARDFAAPAPDARWLGDIAYVPTGEGWRSRAVLRDAHARRVVGWAMAAHRRTARARDARAMALARRRPGAGLVQHPDRGGHDTAAADRQALAAQGVVASLSRSGNCLDHALAESCFATLKTALADRQVWPSRAAARTAIFAWLEVWSNRQRRHAALAYLSPVTFEEDLVVVSDLAA